MEGWTQPTKRDPFSQRLEVVDRFNRFDFDHGLHLASPIRGGKDHVRVYGRWAAADWSILFGSGIDADVEATAKLGLKEAYHPVMLELLSDRPDEDGAHEIATIAWKSPK